MEDNSTSSKKIWFWIIPPILSLTILFAGLSILLQDQEKIMGLLTSPIFIIFLVLNNILPIINIWTGWFPKPVIFLLTSAIGLGWLYALISLFGRYQAKNQTATEAKQKQDNFDKWYKKLNDPDYFQRVLAVGKLAELNDSRVEDALLEAIQDEKWRYFEEVRSYYLTDEDGRQYTQEGLYKGYDKTLRAVIDALGKVGSKRAVPVFLELEKEKKFGVDRLFFLDALGNIGGDEAFQILLDVYKTTPYGPTKDRVSRMLLKLGWQPTDPDEIVRMAILKGDIRSIEKSGPEVVDAILKLYHTFSEKDQWQVAEIIARFKDARSVRLVSDLCKNAEDEMKTMSIRSLNSGMSMDFDKSRFVSKACKASLVIQDLDQALASQFVRKAIDNCPNKDIPSDLIGAIIKMNDLSLVEGLYDLLTERNFQPPVATFIKMQKNSAFIEAFRQHPKFNQLSQYEQKKFSQD